MTNEERESRRQPATPARTPSRPINSNWQDRLLRIEEAGEILGVSIRMIHRLVAAGELPKVKIGKSTCFRLLHVQELIERGTQL